MIYLKTGITQSIWLSLRESSPIGSTNSFKFTFTNDVSNESKVFYPIDLQPNNKWSKFNIIAQPNEDLSQSKINMVDGMWNFIVEDSSIVLETGKVLVEGNKAWITLNRPDKTKIVMRR